MIYELQLGISISINISIRQCSMSTYLIDTQNLLNWGYNSSNTQYLQCLILTKNLCCMFITPILHIRQRG